MPGSSRIPNMPCRSTLRELEATTRTALTVFFAFLHAAIASQEPGVAKGRFHGLVQRHQRAAKAHDDRAALAGVSTAVRVDDHIHLAAGAGDIQRAEDRLAIALEGEVIVERAAIDLDL